MSTALDPRAPTTLVGLVRARLDAVRTGADPFSPPVRHVIGALELADDMKDGLSAPTLVVVCLREQAGPNQVPDPDAGGVVQRVTATLGIYLGVPSRNERGGDKWKAGAALDALVAQVRAALLAWAPEGRFDAFASPPRITGRWAPLELRSGHLVSLRAAVAWWEDRYETHRLVRGTVPADPPGTTPSTVMSGLYDVDPERGHGRLAGEVAC